MPKRKDMTAGRFNEGPVPESGQTLAPRMLYLCLQQLREGQAAYSHVHEIVRGLQRRGVVVDLVAAYPATETPPRGLARRAWRMLIAQLLAARSVRRCDAIYVRYHPLALPLCLVARITGCPIVMEVNGPLDDLYASYPSLRSARSVLDWIGTKVVRMSSAVVAVTDELAAWVATVAVNARIAVIPNGANTDVFRPQGPAHQMMDGTTYAIFFGALARWQGIDVMLAAVRSPAWPSGCKLLIVGDGVMRQSVIAAAAESARVVYVGSVLQHELPALIRGAVASLIVKSGLPGLRFGLSPLKLFESLACGTPVVVSDWPGQAEWVREVGCGVVVQPGSAEECVKAVADIVARPEWARDMGLRGAAWVKAHHSWEARAEDTLGVVRAVLRPGAAVDR